MCNTLSIDEEFYCGAASHSVKNQCISGELKEDEKGRKYYTECNPNCVSKHRKWPTPEQFLEEYGFEYPDDSAVYVLIMQCGDGKREWKIFEYKEAKCFNKSIEPVVCSCTPFGKPPLDWRLK